jgi:hydroxymethylpyrimidine pyrophosphatase-like HAD family hydrolase
MLALDELRGQELGSSVAPRACADEKAFYAHYGWCLNPQMNVGQAAAHLRDELQRLSSFPSGWQRREIAIHIWLLASGILNAADERLRGKTIRIAKLRRFATPIERVAALSERGMRRQLRNWRDAWLVGLESMLPLLLGEPTPVGFADVLSATIPLVLHGETVGVPSPFQRLDLTHEDVLALGRALMQRLPDRDAPIALIGLRTSGSYFGPLLRVQLAREGYRNVAFATLEPNKGVDAQERKALRALAARGCTGVLVDDPPHSGGTLLSAIAIAVQAGFRRDALFVLAPTHPAKRDWAKNFPERMVVTLAPDAWHKRELMREERVAAQLAEYVGDCEVTASERAERYTALLHSSSADARVPRMKRVYEVRARGEAMFVLAKSVGWGFLGYPAFLAAERLAGRVPRLLGLRDGILYTQYVPQSGEARPRAEEIADYIAARARSLRPDAAPNALAVKSRNGAVRLLEKSLAGAYGRLLGTAMRPQVGAELRKLPCANPAWVDGNMQASEWIAGPGGALKTDFEHHGAGKAGVNVLDPAFDLAGAIINCDLSADDEQRLLDRYIEASGDADVRSRLFTAKLLAGIWNMSQAQEQVLGPARDTEALARAHARFIRAWDFLTVETARHLGREIAGKRPSVWRAPLVFLDVDGVIDRRLFGYPASTAAGVQALSLLAPGSTVLNTARCVSEVKAYCEAYGLSGGVAEYGSYVWDALRQRGRLLVSEESLRQLETLRAKLQSLPGVFVDERYTYSVRAFCYRGKSDGLLASLLHSAKRADIGEGAVTPLSPVLVKQVIADLGLDRLRVHPTTIDTTVVAREVDKGTGLIALRDWVLGPEAETIAVGDSDADLPMFKAATRNFAPANIGCRSAARLLGCEIVSERYQRGLLQIAQRIAGTSPTPVVHSAQSEHDKFLAQIFAAADLPLTTRLWAVLRSGNALSILLR